MKFIISWNCCHCVASNDCNHTANTCIGLSSIQKRKWHLTLLILAFSEYFPDLQADYIYWIPHFSISLFLPRNCIYLFLKFRSHSKCFLKSWLWKIGESLGRTVQIPSCIIVPLGHNWRENTVGKIWTGCWGLMTLFRSTRPNTFSFILSCAFSSLTLNLILNTWND